MVRFTTISLDADDSCKKFARQMNDKTVTMECDRHPYEVSVISIICEQKINHYKIESVCCDKYRATLIQFIDTLK